MFRAKKLSSQITIFGLLLAIVPFIVLTVIGFTVFINTVVEQQVVNLQILVEAKENAVIQYVQEKNTRIESFASDGYIRQKLKELMLATSTNEVQDLQNKMRKHFVVNKMSLDERIEEMEIVALDGIVLVSSAGLEGEDRSHDEHFKSMLPLPAGELFFSFHESIATHEHIGDLARKASKVAHLKIGTRVRSISGSEILGIMTLHYATDDLGELMQGLHSGGSVKRENSGELEKLFSTLDVYLVNADGYMVTESRFYGSDVILTKMVQTEPVQTCLAEKKEAQGLWKDYRGVSVYGASSCIPELGIVAIAELDREEVFAPIRSMFLLTVIIFGMSIIGIVLVTAYFSRRLLRPISYLIKTAQSISSGDLKARARTEGPDEVVYLATVFNAMLDTIGTKEKANIKLFEQLQKERNLLDAKVKDRTLALEQEKSKLEQVTENMMAGAILVGAHEHVLFANKRICEIVRVTESDQVLPGLFKLFPDAEFVDQYDQSGTSQGGFRSFNFVRQVDDTYYEITIRCLTPSIHNASCGRLVLVRDITKEKLLERSKTELVGIASHQLRTPLTVTRMNTELLLSGSFGDLSTQQKELLKDIEGSAIRLISMVNNMLDITQAEKSTDQFDTEKMNIGDLVDTVVKNLGQFAISKNVTLHWITPGHACMVDAHKEKLMQCIMNVIDNAIKYSRTKQTVTVEIIEKNMSTEVVVKDEGIGIPEVEQEHVFQRFYRASNVINVVSQGSGLGLYVVRVFMRRMGGDVRFESQKDKGTTFYLTLKRADR